MRELGVFCHILQWMSRLKGKVCYVTYNSFIDYIIKEMIINNENLNEELHNEANFDSFIAELEKKEKGIDEKDTKAVEKFLNDIKIVLLFKPQAAIHSTETNKIEMNQTKILYAKKGLMIAKQFALMRYEKYFNNYINNNKEVLSKQIERERNKIKNGFNKSDSVFDFLTPKEDNYSPTKIIRTFSSIGVIVLGVVISVLMYKRYKK